MGQVFYTLLSSNLQYFGLTYGIILLSVFLQSASSQTIVDLKSIGEEEGLSARIVNFVIRDDRGLFYVISRKSIQQFDGNQFSDVNSQVLSEQNELLSDIISVEKKSSNRYVLNIKNAEHQYILNTEKNIVEFIASNKKRYLKDGIDYIVSYQDSTYAIVSEEKRKGINIELFNFPMEIIGQGNYCITQDEFHKVCIFNNNKAISEVYKGRIIRVEENIYLWSPDGVYKFSQGNFNLIHRFTNEKEGCGLLKKDKLGNIIAAYSDRTSYFDNNYFNKLYVLDKEENLINYSSCIKEYPAINDIYSDNVFHKMMLVGYNGMRVCSFLRDGSEIFFQEPGIMDGEFGKIIIGVAADTDGHLIAQSESGEISQYNTNKNQFEELFSTKNKVISEALSNLKYDKKSDCFYTRGYSSNPYSDIYKYNKESGKLTSRRLNFKLGDFDFLSKDRMLLTGYESSTGEAFLAEYNFEQNKLIVKRKDLKRILSVFLDGKNKTIWVSTMDGIKVLGYKYNTITKIDKHQSKDRYILHDKIAMFLPYNDHLVACSRGGGIYVIEPITQRVLRNINSQSGLTEDMAVAAIEDNAGRLWVGTFNGLNVLDNNYNSLKKIYAFEGLPNKEFNTHAVAKNKDGKLVFGTLNGLCIIDPEKVLNWERSYKAHINKIQLYNGRESRNIANKDPIIFYNSVDSLIMTYSIADYFTYPFVSTSVTLSQKGDPFYRSVSYSGSSVLTDFETGENEIYLKTDNKSLDQVIRVKVNSDRRGLYYFFIITAVLLGLVYFISKSVIEANKKKEQEKTETNKKIAELQLASLQAQMNPHFIFNALGSIQYFIQTHNADKADEYLSDFAKLMRKILESSKQKLVSVREELKMLELYIGLEQLRFEGMFDYTMDIDPMVDQEMKIPPMIIQPIIENAINHGIYNLTDRHGSLHIKLVEESEENIVITIEDNGVGRKKAQELRNKIHASRGMQIVKERIDTINKSEAMEVQMLTEDLMKKTQPIGTRVIINIKELY